MKRSSITVAFLIMIVWTYIQVWGAGIVSARSMPDGSVINSSAGMNVRGTGAGAPVGSLQDSPTPRQHWVTLSWDRGLATNVTGEDVVGYNVYRRIRAASLYIRINRDLILDTNYVDDSVRGGEIYYYQTTAVSGAGIESGPSNRIRIRVPYP